MKEQWIMTRKEGDYEKLSSELGVNNIVGRLLCNRAYSNIEEAKKYLYAGRKQMYSAKLLKGVVEAVEIITKKIESKKKIRIIGDYDIDGVTSTLILVEGLKTLGAMVDYDIPDRIKDGYGLSVNLIDRAINDQVDTIITCDNGIAARNEISYAKENGITVIITDHHEVPYEENEEGEKRFILPDADVVIDPKQVGCEFPFKEICGATVAYKLVDALFEELGMDKNGVEYLLSFAAIGTIGDVMPLVDENRIIVKEGLGEIAKTKNKGLKALCEVNNVDYKNLSPYHVGFVLGPCINASGRLDTASKAISLFLEEDTTKVTSLAMELKELNEERKALTLRATEEAKKQVMEELERDKVLLIYLEECHESIAGIIAGRIRETYNKPAIVMTKAEEGIKGSGRSIEEYNLYEHLNKCANLLNKFGGHKLAAGLSMDIDKLEEFREKLNKDCKLVEEDFVKKIAIDMQLPIKYATIDSIKGVSALEPFGVANQAPLFAEKQLEIISLQILGKKKNVLKLKLRQDETVVDAIMFYNIDEFQEELVSRYGKVALELLMSRKRASVYVDITYEMSINEYMGNQNVQLMIKNYRF